MAEQRARWHALLSAVPAARLLFVDESGANTKMARLCGRAATGKRLVCHVPFGRYETQTLIAAVRLDGVRAPWVFREP